MRLNDLFSETTSAIGRNKGRTALTILGIVIGIGSVIAMLSIGESAQKSIQGDVKAMGENVLQITINEQTAKDNKVDIKGLNFQDAENIRKMPEFTKVFELSQGIYKINYRKKSEIININAFNYGFLESLEFEAEYGRFFETKDVDTYNKIAILGPEAAEKLFGKNYDGTYIGEDIKINGVNFKVAGITKSKKLSLGFAQFDNIIYIPITTFQKYISGTKDLDLLWVDAKPEYSQDYLKDVVEKTLSKPRNLKNTEIEYFRINSQDDILSITNTITSVFTVLLSSIAGISLLVGGIGIMNMMLTTVTERTREIGLRKAIGARPSDISKQFLAESIILTLIGGVIGIILGLGLSAVVTKIMNIPNIISISSILLAFSISGGIGILFGYYPARRASKLNPIEALRYE